MIFNVFYNHLHIVNIIFADFHSFTEIRKILVCFYCIFVYNKSNFKARWKHGKGKDIGTSY